MKWTAAHLPDLTGRRFVVTGANTGIGFDTALQLGLHGGDVVLACRDMDKGDMAMRRITEAGAPGNIRVVQLDLASFNSIRRFPEQVDDIDALILNAGVMVPPFSTTRHGFELTWGTNVVGHFLLTALLMPRIRDRVVTVSSIAHHQGRIDFDNLRGEKPYVAWREYRQSKLGNLVFALELDRRLRTADSRLRSVACHPGVTATDLVRHMGIVGPLVRPLLQSSAMGALPTLYAAVEDVPGGSYIGPRGRREWRGHPGPARIADHAIEAELGRRLWRELEASTDTPFRVDRRTLLV